MKSLVIAAAALLSVVSPALARDSYDLYHRQRASPNAAIWTGVYIEAGLGTTSGNGEVAIPGFFRATLGDAAWSGHLGVGYDYIVAPHLLIGMLGRVEWSGVSYDVTLGSLGIPLAENDNPEWMIGGRIGFIPRSDWMVYGLVGYKFADLDIRLDNFVNNFIQVGSVENPSRDGWVLGVGLEVMATDCIFVGLEYTAHLANSDRIDNSPIRVETTDHSGKVRAGLKFW